MIKQCNTENIFNIILKDGDEYKISSCDGINEKYCILKIKKEENKPTPCTANIDTSGNYWSCCSYFPDLNNAIIVKYSGGSNCPSNKTLTFNTDFKIENSELIKLWLFGQNNTTNRRNIDIAIEIISDIEGITKGKHNVTLWQEEGVCNATPIKFSVDLGDFKRTTNTYISWKCNSSLTFDVKVKCKVWYRADSNYRACDITDDEDYSYTTITLPRGKSSGKVNTTEPFARIIPFAIENINNNEYSVVSSDLYGPVLGSIKCGMNNLLTSGTIINIEVKLDSHSKPTLGYNVNITDSSSSFQKQGLNNIINPSGSYGDYCWNDGDGYYEFSLNSSGTGSGVKPSGVVEVRINNTYPNVIFKCDYSNKLIIN